MRGSFRPTYLNSGDRLKPALHAVGLRGRTQRHQAPQHTDSFISGDLTWVSGALHLGRCSAGHTGQSDTAPQWAEGRTLIGYVKRCGCL